MNGSPIDVDEWKYLVTGAVSWVVALDMAYGACQSVEVFG